MEYIPKWSGMVTDYDILSLNGSLFGYNFGAFLDGYTYHTLLDDSSMIKHGALQEFGENLGLLSRNILSSDFQAIENIIDNDSLIYFDIYGRYLIVYKMSTSIIIQRTLIVLILVFSIILIIFDYKYHHQTSFVCIDSRCIYFYFKHSFSLRIISIIIYFISNLISVAVGALFSIFIAWIISLIRPLSWYGNSTLTIFLFSLPCFIGFITVAYLWSLLHGFILKKYPQNSLRINDHVDGKYFNKISFDFEQHLSVLLIYSVLMIVSSHFDNRLFYIILIWSIFVCPIYFLSMIIEFVIHWKQIDWNLIKQGNHWLYLPFIISLFPLTHTIDIVNRLLRIHIPLMTRGFSLGSTFRGNMIICSFVNLPSIFFVLIFIPILQRTKYFGRTLIILLITFFITVIFTFVRPPFTNIHPNTFYALHTSNSYFKVSTFSTVPLVSRSSSIRVLTFSDLALLPILDQFSTQSGHMLRNKQCSSPTDCTFDDTFNRTNAIQDIQIEFLTNFTNHTIIVRHVLSYNIHVSSSFSIEFIVRNQMNIPRTETIIDVVPNKSLLLFGIDIKIRRCDLIDSPFLLLFTRLMPNIVSIGDGKCQAIADDAALLVFLDK
jgi:hypothetical protein